MEERYFYSISNEDLHEFFKLHNELVDCFTKLNHKIKLLQLLKASCVELEAYKNENYDLLCMTIAETDSYCSALNELADKCSVHMSSMLGEEEEV